MLVGKKEKGGLESGYVFVPYIISSKVSTISDFRKNLERKNKINKIFNLNLVDQDYNSFFNSKKLISSRYCTKIINSNLYGSINNYNMKFNLKNFKRIRTIENIFRDI